MNYNKIVNALPSSKYMIKNMLGNIDFNNARVLLKYGLGNIAITKHLLELMSEDAILFIFETNNRFIDSLLKIRDKRLIIINADTEDAQIVLNNRYKISSVDYIISTISYSLLDRRKRKRVISKTYNLLNKKGKFITYQYTGLIYQLLKYKFHQTNFNINFLNMPPAIIFAGIK